MNLAEASAVQIGSLPVSSVYFGSTLIWPSQVSFFYEELGTCDFDYWYAEAYYEIQNDGSALYTARYSTATEFKDWSKTTPAGAPIDFTGLWTGDEDTTMSLGSTAECDIALFFNAPATRLDCSFDTVDLNVFACIR